jgi:hypothetical protein
LAKAAISLRVISGCVDQYIRTDGGLAAGRAAFGAIRGTGPGHFAGSHGSMLRAIKQCAALGQTDVCLMMANVMTIDAGGAGDGRKILNAG